jgi:glucan phosphoethanolaminetransferase (alkaline phosphatase superfamily)
MAQEKSDSYSMSATSMLLQFNDLIIATLSFLSYLILYIARYLTIAMYHFFWIFFMISAPLLLLFNLFEGTQQITKNLFKGMIEVACWKIVWAILGAMLAALSFGDLYRTEGSYLVIIVMNFVIAVAMLMTPMMVKSLVGGGLQSMSSSIGAASIAAIAAAPGKAAASIRTSRAFINDPKGFANKQIDKAFNPNSKYNRQHRR